MNERQFQELLNICDERHISSKENMIDVAEYFSSLGIKPKEAARQYNWIYGYSIDKIRNIGDLFDERCLDKRRITRYFIRAFTYSLDRTRKLFETLDRITKNKEITNKIVNEAPSLIGRNSVHVNKFAEMFYSRSMNAAKVMEEVPRAVYCALRRTQGYFDYFNERGINAKILEKYEKILASSLSKIKELDNYFEGNEMNWAKIFFRNPKMVSHSLKKIKAVDRETKKLLSKRARENNPQIYGLSLIDRIKPRMRYARKMHLSENQTLELLCGKRKYKTFQMPLIA